MPEQTQSKDTAVPSLKDLGYPTKATTPYKASSIACRLPDLPYFLVRNHLIIILMIPSVIVCDWVIVPSKGFCSSQGSGQHPQGGETAALARMADQLSDKEWVAAFEKPKGNPAAFKKPATTCLSPYLKFGCLSARLFYSQLQAVRWLWLSASIFNACACAQIEIA